MIVFKDKGINVYATEHVGDEQPPPIGDGSGVTSRAMSLQPSAGTAPVGVEYPFPQIKVDDDDSMEIGRKPDGPVGGSAEVIVESEEETLRKRGVKRRRKDIEPGVVRGVYEVRSQVDGCDCACSMQKRADGGRLHHPRSAAYPHATRPTRPAAYPCDDRTTEPTATRHSSR
jgi:hypothetical protein